MSWGVAFLGALDADVLRAVFRVVCLNGPDTTYATSPTFAELEGDAPDADVIMGVEGPEVSGEALQLPDVSCSHGDWSWDAVTSNLSRMIQATRKGRILALEAKINGMGWERVALGAVRLRSFTADQLGAAMTVRCGGMGSLLGQRYTVGAGQRSLFRETLKRGVLAADYTAGDATVTLDSTSEWAEFDGAGVYYFRIHPSDDTESFVLRATGRTATTFTGVGASAVWGTTEADALSESNVGLQRGTRLSASYTAGDASLTVLSSAFASGLDADGVYYLRLYPTGGDPFVLRATARGAGTFTVDTSGRLGTTAVNCLNADEVQLVRVVQGHPVECALKVLQSTGAGTNGPWDLLPADYGLALGRDVVDDTESRRAIVQSQPASGAGLFEIEVPDTEEITHVGDWMRAWLAPFGAFITVRHGSIVVRVLRDPVKVGGHTVLSLDDGDVVEMSGDLDADSYSAAYPEVVYNAAGVVIRSEESAGVVDGESALTVSVEHLYTNRAAVLTEVSRRTSVYYHRVPSALRLRCVGLRAAQLAPGDLVYLSSRWSSLIPDASGRTTTDYRGCVVVSVAPEWTGAACEIELLHYPESAGT